MKEIKGYQYNGERIADLPEISSYSQEGYQYGGGHIIVRKADDGKHIIAFDNGADTDYYLLDSDESLEAKDHRDMMIHDDDADTAIFERITWGLVSADFYAVNEKYEGECRIITERIWNSHKSWEFASGDNYLPIVFESYANARKWIAEQEEETYYLAHNEAGRPNYIIVE